MMEGYRYRKTKQKDKERQERIESDMRWGLKDPESGEEAQTWWPEHMPAMPHV